VCACFRPADSIFLRGLSYGDLNAVVGKDEGRVGAGEFGGGHLDSRMRESVELESRC
jgi:hypothetical protein